jgi:hypothetical protein
MSAKIRNVDDVLTMIQGESNKDQILNNEYKQEYIDTFKYTYFYKIVIDSGGPGETHRLLLAYTGPCFINKTFDHTRFMDKVAGLIRSEFGNTDTKLYFHSKNKGLILFRAVSYQVKMYNSDSVKWKYPEYVPLSTLIKFMSVDSHIKKETMISFIERIKISHYEIIAHDYLTNIQYSDLYLESDIDTFSDTKANVIYKIDTTQDIPKYQELDISGDFVF